MNKKWWRQPPEQLIELHEKHSVATAYPYRRTSTGSSPLDELFCPSNKLLKAEIWERIANLSVEGKEDYQQAPEKYVKACMKFYDACVGSLGIPTNTPAQRKKDLLTLAKKARELRDLYGKSELAIMPLRHHIQNLLLGDESPEGQKFVWVSQLYEDLEALAREAEEAANRPHEFQAAKKLVRRDDGSASPETARLFFVKQMTPQMKELFGDPCASLVALAATVITGVDTDESFVWIADSRTRKRP